MSRRRSICQGCVVGLSVFIVATICNAAEVESLVLTCLDRQEFSRDDVYLVIRGNDGKIIEFDSNDQEGLSRANPKNMTNGTKLKLSSSTRKRLSFDKKLTIVVKEKDSDESIDDTFGEVVIKANEEDDETLSGGTGARKYEYQIEWKTSN